MSNLENLVPPLELCQKIPAGKFEDSALIIDEYGIVYGRGGTIAKNMMVGMKTYPAPTLAEIMDALVVIGDPCVYWEGGFYVRDDDNNKTTYDMTNPATAALKLWFKLNPPEVKT